MRRFKMNDVKMDPRVSSFSPHAAGNKHHGLYNQGATCYLNSVLQVLFMTKDFREAVERNPCEKGDDYIDHQLKTLFHVLKDNTAETHNITRKLGIHRVYEQRDAAEHFDQILSLTSPEASKIFSGLLAHQSECSGCHILTETDGQFWHLPLALVDPCSKCYSVVDGIEEFFKVSFITGENQLFCDHCDAKADATVKCVVKHHPEVLMLLLKRFEFNYRYMTYVKNNCVVDVPYTLQIPENQMYELYAVVDHYGDLRGGHYTATVQSQDDEKWYNFNDTRVTLLDYQIFQVDHTEKSQSVYLLFYRKNQNACTQDMRGESTSGHFSPAASNHDDQKIRERERSGEKNKNKNKPEVDQGRKHGGSNRLYKGHEQQREERRDDKGHKEQERGDEEPAQRRETFTTKPYLSESVEDQDKRRFDGVRQNKPEQEVSVTHTTYKNVGEEKQAKEQENKEDKPIQSKETKRRAELAERGRLTENQGAQSAKRTRLEDSQKKKENSQTKHLNRAAEYQDSERLDNVKNNINKDEGHKQEVGQDYSLQTVGVDKTGDEEKMELDVKDDEEGKTGRRKLTIYELYTDGLQNNESVGDGKKNEPEDDWGVKHGGSNRLYKGYEQQREERRDDKGQKEQERGDEQPEKKENSQTKHLNRAAEYQDSERLDNVKNNINEDEGHKQEVGQDYSLQTVGVDKTGDEEKMELDVKDDEEEKTGRRKLTIYELYTDGLQNNESVGDGKKNEPEDDWGVKHGGSNRLYKGYEQQREERRDDKGQKEQERGDEQPEKKENSQTKHLNRAAEYQDSERLDNVKNNIIEDEGHKQEVGQDYSLQTVGVDKTGDEEKMELDVKDDEEEKTGRRKLTIYELYTDGLQNNESVGDGKKNEPEDDWGVKHGGSNRLYKGYEQQREERRDDKGQKEQERGDEQPEKKENSQTKHLNRAAEYQDSERLDNVKNNIIEDEGHKQEVGQDYSLQTVGVDKTGDEEKMELDVKDDEEEKTGRRKLTIYELYTDGLQNNESVGDGKKNEPEDDWGVKHGGSNRLYKGYEQQREERRDDKGQKEQERGDEQPEKKENSQTKHLNRAAEYQDSERLDNVKNNIIEDEGHKQEVGQDYSLQTVGVDKTGDEEKMELDVKDDEEEKTGRRKLTIYELYTDGLQNNESVGDGKKNEPEDDWGVKHGGSNRLYKGYEQQREERRDDKGQKEQERGDEQPEKKENSQTKHLNRAAEYQDSERLDNVKNNIIEDEGHKQEVGQDYSLQTVGVDKTGDEEKMELDVKDDEEEKTGRRKLTIYELYTDGLQNNESVGDGKKNEPEDDWGVKHGGSNRLYKGYEQQREERRDDKGQKEQERGDEQPEKKENSQTKHLNRAAEYQDSERLDNVKNNIIEDEGHKQEVGQDYSLQTVGVDKTGDEEKMELDVKDDEEEKTGRRKLTIYELYTDGLQNNESVGDGKKNEPEDDWGVKHGGSNRLYKGYEQQREESRDDKGQKEQERGDEQPEKKENSQTKHLNRAAEYQDSERLDNVKNNIIEDEGHKQEVGQDYSLQTVGVDKTGDEEKMEIGRSESPRKLNIFIIEENVKKATSGSQIIERTIMKIENVKILQADSVKTNVKKSRKY